MVKQSFMRGMSMRANHLRRIMVICLAIPDFAVCTRALHGQGTFQGVFDFSNTGLNGGSRAPVFGPDPNNPSLQQWGNPPNATPPGTQTYAGQVLSGNGYIVQAWYSTNAVSGSTDLMANAKPVAGSLGTNLSGGFFPLPPSNVNIPDALANPAYDPSYFAFTNEPLYAFLQVRVWDNNGGQYPSWDSAWNAARAGSGFAVGWSRVFWQPLTGPLDSRPWPAMPYFESFNTFIVPEPGGAALLLLGGTFSCTLFQAKKRRKAKRPQMIGSKEGGG